MPLQQSLISGSLNLSVKPLSPISSIISPQRILTKIRLELVVSSSFIFTTSRTAHETESVASKCPKKRAMLRSRLVS